MNNKEFKELKELREAFSSHFNKPHTVPTEQWAWDFFTNYLKSNDEIKREVLDIMNNAVKFQEKKNTRDGLLKADGIRYAKSKVKHYLTKKETQ